MRLVAVSVVLTSVLGLADQGSDTGLRAQLGQAQSWLAQHPPDGMNAPARRERMAVLQAAGDRISDLDYRDYARAWETNQPLADLLEAKHPVLGYLRGATERAMDEIRRTRVREGLAVWSVYNMGYVFKTPNACFGIDLDGRGVERLAPDLDFLLNTHEHGDHVHEPLLREMLARGKPVVTRWHPGSLRVSQSTNLVFGEVRIRVDIGDHHREQPRQRDNMLMFEVDCGPSANRAVIYHSGDNNNIETMRPAQPVDLLILHTSVGLSVPETIRRLKPKMTFVSHVMELGHSPLPPHAWRWSYDYAFDVIRDIPEREATVLTWGERWLAPGSALQPAEPVAQRQIVYVNNQTGSDAFTGCAAAPSGDGTSGPFKTIMQAVRQCAAGARIEVANTGSDYRETVSIEGFKKGQADAPLIIDGHGAYVSGLVAVAPEQWVAFKEDIYYFANKVGDADFKPRGWFESKRGDAVYGVMPNSNWLGSLKHQGWFAEKEAPEIFLLNGKPGPNSLTLSDIQPGGFFYDAQSAVMTNIPGQRCLFFRLPAGQALKACSVELPLNHGVYVSDDYVTICNLGSRYSQDDGFSGFWGQGVVLRNIHACFNCDQGVSFHGTSTTLIDGALIERNAGCGIVDVMSCTTIYRNTTVRGNYPLGVLFSGFAHALYNCRIADNCGVQVQIEKGASGSLVNCLVVGRGDLGSGAAVRMEQGRLDHCTILDSPVGLSVQRAASVRNSIIARCPTAVSIDKKAEGEVGFDKTLLELGAVQVDTRKVTASDWAEFAKAHPRWAGALIASPALEGPFFQLPKSSPFLTAGENGTAPGVKPNLPKE